MKKILGIVISILIVIAIMTVGLISIIDDKQEVGSDALKFKEEYELLNNKYYEEYDLTVSTMNIDKDNPIKYLSDENIIEKLTNGTHIIYFGFPECGWCRRAVPVLLNFAKKNKIETIYYYNFYNLRNEYEKGENKDKVKLYESITEILKDNLEKSYEEGNHQGQKRLSAPDVYFIKNGNIVGSHYKLVESYLDYNLELTTDQTEELLTIYQNNYDKMFANICIEEDC